MVEPKNGAEPKNGPEPKNGDETKNSSPAIAAAVILIGFGVLAYFVPTIMLALGKRSHIAAIIFSIVFVLGFFAIFWLRARSQKKHR